MARFARLAKHWASIDRPSDDPFAAVMAAQWASPPGYREALQLAKLILIGASIDPASNMGGQAFTLSLAAIWERALRRLFSDLADHSGWHCVSDQRRVRRWDDPAGRNDKKRRLTADVLAEREEARWVLDTKYKRDFGDESRIDRFQICAYVMAFDAERGSLVYPTAAESSESRVLLSRRVSGKNVQIESIALR